LDFSDENHEDDDSYDTLPQVDEAADPLFDPGFSLPTWDTVESGAVDIRYFFVTYGKTEETQRRVCRICG